MNEKKNALAIRRPTALITFVQGMGMCAMLLVFYEMAVRATLIPHYALMDRTGLLEAHADNGGWLLRLLPEAGVGGCLLWLLAEFVLMCGRVKKGTAFTAKNVHGLGRMALAFAIGGALLIPLGKPLMDWLTLGMRDFHSPLLWPLPTFAAWAAALMVRAIQVLMRRAVELQTEQDLTV